MVDEDLPYELIFEVDPVSQDLEDLIIDELDAFIAHQNGLCFVTASAAGPDGRSAATSAVAVLRRLGVVVRRLVPDLVTRAEIAQRTGLTRQGVGTWARGERGQNFPATFSTAAGGLWLWAEVNEWLASTDREHDPVRFLNRREHAILDADLQANYLTGQVLTVDIGFRVSTDCATYSRLDVRTMGAVDLVGLER